MNEIKYRGISKKENKFVYGVPIPNGFGQNTIMICITSDAKIAYPLERLHEFCIEVIPETVSQYTGLKDCNGIEIYGSDIVKNEQGSVGYISYLIQEAGFVVVLKKSDYKLGHRNTGEPYRQAVNHEIIGNKYENIELLEVN